MRKRKTSICFSLIICAAILAFVILFFCTPTVPFRDSQMFDKNSTVVNKIVDGESIDITNKIDLDTLFSLLPLLRCEKIPMEKAGFSMSDMTYQIYGIYNHKSVYITFGKPEVSIISMNDNNNYKIYNNEAWNALMQLLARE